MILFPFLPSDRKYRHKILIFKQNHKKAEAQMIKMRLCL